MPPPATREAFLDLVRGGELADPAALDLALSAEPPGPGGPRELAAHLVRLGLLSEFQARQALAGKSRGFTLAGKYRVLELLGQGGMGTVYLAEHTRLRRPVAVKVLPPRLTGTPAALARFEREGRALAGLDHPNVVRCHDIDRDGQTHFLVLEFVDGVSLQQLVSATGPLPPVLAAEVARQAAAGLAHTAALGWLHRDIKPANLMLGRDGVVKLLDLGIARLADGGDRTGITAALGDGTHGTADYVSPEQAMNRPDLDVRADLYSLGATLYFLLTGRPPFADEDIVQKLLAHQVRPARPVAELATDTPPALAALTDRLLAKRPEDRVQTPAELMAALAPLAEPVPHGFGEAAFPHWCPLVRAALSENPARREGAVLPERPTKRTPAVDTTPLPPSGRLPPLAAEPPPPRRSRLPLALGGVAALLALAAGIALWPAAPAPATAVKPAGPAGAVLTAELAARHIGQTRTVEFRVTGVAGKVRVKLLSGNSKGDSAFMAVIQKSAVALFDLGTVDELKAHFKGKTIRVTGQVSPFYADPDGDEPVVNIVVSKPAELVVVD